MPLARPTVHDNVAALFKLLRLSNSERLVIRGGTSSVIMAAAPMAAAEIVLGDGRSSSPTRCGRSAHRPARAPSVAFERKRAMRPIKYQTVDVDGLRVCFREAGAKSASKLLLLYGFPSASYMFRDLIPLLIDCFHMIAPDLPGFGVSGMPGRGAAPAIVSRKRSTASPRRMPKRLLWRSVIFLRHRRRKPCPSPNVTTI